MANGTFVPIWATIAEHRWDERPVCLHAREAVVVPAGRDLAALIPGAEFVEKGEDPEEAC